MIGNSILFLHEYIYVTIYYRVVRTQKEKRVVELKVSDVQSLYPNRGISDAVIDFYVRYCKVHTSGDNSLINSVYKCLGSCHLRHLLALQLVL